MRWLGFTALRWPAGGLAGAVTTLGARLGIPAAIEADEKRIGYGRPSTPASREAREAGHETEDFSARDVGLVLGTIAVSYAILTGGLFFMIDHLSNARHHRYEAFTPQQTASIATPSPHLEVDPVESYEAYRKHQLQYLYHYDRLGGGYARIPIDRAMALELGQSLDHPALSSSAGGSASGGGGT